MADAVLWDILGAVQTRLQDDLTLTAMGTDPAQDIVNDAIVIQKSLFLEKGHRTPGIVITPPLRMGIDPSMGTNARDDYVYPVLAQIIDKDNQERDQNLRTYLKWREQICRAFQHWQPSSVSSVYITHAVEVDYVDDKLWRRHNWFVGGVELRFFARLSRGAT